MGNKYAQFFAIIKELNSKGASISKEHAVGTFTNGRTTSLSDLSDLEYRALIRGFTNLRPQTEAEAILATYKADPLDATRKAIISQFLSIKQTAEDAIAWAEKTGVNGIKRKFNDYNGQELYKILLNAKKVRTDRIKKFVNRF
jgi:hypothetical protein